MKYTLLIVILLTRTLLTSAQQPVMQQPITQKSLTQQSIIDTATIAQWPTTGSISISQDGQYVLYTIDNIPAGSSTLVIQSTDHAWRQEFPGASKGVFTPDSKRAVFMTKGHNLAFLLLGGEVTQYIPDVNSFQVPKTGSGEWMVYRLHSGLGRLVLHDWLTNRDIIYDSVDKYQISPRGTVLLVEKQDPSDHSYPYEINWVNPPDGILLPIWYGQRSINWVFDNREEQVAFLSEEWNLEHVNFSIWYYRRGMDEAKQWLTDSCHGLDAGLVFDQTQPFRFSRDGERLFFSLTRKRHAQLPPDAVKVDVWHYEDEPLQSVQLLQQQEFFKPTRSFAAMARIGDPMLIRLEQDQEHLDDGRWMDKEGHTLLLSDSNRERLLQKTSLPAAWLVSTQDGSRTLLEDFNATWIWPDRHASSSSPQDKWFIWFDGSQKAYFSFEWTTGIRSNIIRNISRHIPVPLITKISEDKGPTEQNAPAGLGPWLADDSRVFLYDEHDIWLVDPAGIQHPVNITHGYGRKHHLRFRLLLPDSADDTGLTLDTTFLLTAFDPVTKWNGFYQIALNPSTGAGPLNRYLIGPLASLLNRHEDKIDTPVLLNMEPGLQYLSGTQKENPDLNNGFKPLQARDAHTWIVQKENETSSPNYYVTKDFIGFQPLTDIHPERSVNWLSSTQINWTLPDGRPGEGILYKPQHFDPQKQYPVLFSIYEHQSDQLHAFLQPDLMTGPIDIPWFVSRGYLVCLPDIHNSMGEPGQSALDAVVSAATYLSKQPWVNSKKLGITGHSFGGYETNYIVTHSHLFAAALEASGFCDLISFYGAIANGGRSQQPYFETGQGRIGATLWQRPDRYIDNSPIFQTDQVTTPILMMHNIGDHVVPFEQGVEFFTGLRRLGKKAWMLQYDKGQHELRTLEECIDYTIRVTQFFDYYLKDALPPKWMTEGIPARMKGIETGYELDHTDNQP